jgi:uncharacterized protein
MKTKAKIKGLVLKVASRCNLNCEYCYMYNLGDETYKSQPKFMSQDIIERILYKTKTYLTNNGSKTFHFIFHGGEPLLVEPSFYQTFVRKANEILPTFIKPIYIIQTNGVLLSPEWCEILGDLGFRIGISLDGLTESANRFRVNHSGGSSLNQTLFGIKNAQNSKYLKYLPGILSVINLESNPVDLYVGYKHLKIRNINFLLPDGTHSNLPTRFDANKTEYADWLIKLFNLWFYDRDVKKPQISFFNQIVNLILGGNTTYENFGGGNSIYLIVETNGDIEPQDSLKACGDGFTKTQLNITKHSLQNAFQNTLIRKCIDSQDKLCEQCENCSVVEICRGGFITHRHSDEKMFNNPSIYCKDLEKIITHISEILEATLMT